MDDDTVEETEAANDKNEEHSDESSNQTKGSSPKENTDENESSGKEKEDVKEPDEEKETETETEIKEEPVEIKREDLTDERLLNDINYGIILAYMEKFTKHLSIKEYTYKTFDAHLLEAKQMPRKLLDFQLNLIKNLNMGKNAKKDKWEFYIGKVNLISRISLIQFYISTIINHRVVFKFMQRYCRIFDVDLEKQGYLSLTLDIRVRLVKVSEPYI